VTTVGIPRRAAAASGPAPRVCSTWAWTTSGRHWSITAAAYLVASGFNQLPSPVSSIRPAVPIQCTVTPSTTSVPVSPSDNPRAIAPESTSTSWPAAATWWAMRWICRVAPLVKSGG
jgi:hypothetical protein